MKLPEGSTPGLLGQESRGDCSKDDEQVSSIGAWQAGVSATSSPGDAQPFSKVW
jgi:hypothetical protein